MHNFSIQGPIHLSKGDDISVKAGECEIFINFDDGVLTVSNESTTKPTVVEILKDGTMKALEGTINTVDARIINHE